MYADSVRSSAESALARATAPKPVLLLFAQFGTLLFGAMATLFLLLAPWDIGSYSIGNEVVSGPEFLRRAGMLFGLIGGLCLAIGIGLWLDRSWTRPLMLSYWPVSAVLGFVMPAAPVEDAIALAVFAGVCGGVAALYLYAKGNVRAYYAALTPPVRTIPSAGA